MIMDLKGGGGGGGGGGGISITSIICSIVICTHNSVAIVLHLHFIFF